VTFKDIRDRIYSLLLFGGWTSTAVKPDYAYLANMGLKLFTQESQHCVEPLTLYTVGGQLTYSAQPDPSDPREWVMLFDNAAYGFSQCPFSTDYNALASSGQMGLQVPGTTQPSVTSGLTTSWLPQTALTNLDNMNRLWRYDAPSTPQQWFWYDPKHIGLWPVPCSDGIAISWLGIRYEPSMVNDSDTPLVPDVECEGVALLGAAYHAKLYARGDELKTVAAYQDQGIWFAQRTKELMSAKNASLVTRYVQRAPQEYMVTGMKQIPFFEVSR